MSKMLAGCILLIAVLFINCRDTVKSSGRVFYIDSKTGNDSANGLSPETAWRSFVHINGRELIPGDQLLMRSGTSYNDALIVSARGTSAMPVIINSYGSGPKPLINGNGQRRYTLEILNSEYIEVKNIAVTNMGVQPEAKRVGVLVEAIDCGAMHHIVLDSLDVHDVNGSLIKKEGGGSAIFWENKGDSIPTRFIDLQIKNCHLYRCGRNGITSAGNIDRRKWYPSLGVVIRNNLLEEIPGDGIVPIGCDSALIEYNIMRDCPDSLPYGDAAAGFWPWSSDNTIIQFNEVSGQKAKWDAQAYDCDFNCIGTTIRYNYSHDNYGGFLLVCNPGHLAEKNTNIATRNNTISFNLSINDGIRPYDTRRAGWFSPTLHITGPTENTFVENNIFLIPSKKKGSIPVEFLKTGNWGDAWPINTTIKDNYVYSSVQPENDWGKGDKAIYENNHMGIYRDRDKQSVLFLLDKIISGSNSTNKKGFEKLRNFISR